MQRDLFEGEDCVTRNNPSMKLGVRAITFLALALVGGTLRAERALAPKLLPRDTLVYVRVPDVHELVERFKQTNTGRMLQDPQLQPLVQDTYRAARDALSEVQDKLGLTLDQLLAIPQGEITFALFAREQAFPGAVLLVDVGDQAATMRKLLDKGLEVLGVTRFEEDLDGERVQGFEGPHGRRVVWIEKDETFAFCSDADVAKLVLKNWTGSDDGGLTENPQFGAVMHACRAPRDERPQFVWYADPIETVRQFAQGNFGAQAGLAVLPAIGLDGLQAVGGTMTFVVDEFDAIQHIHVLISSPRSGVLEAIALESGDLTPESWVPGDVATYITMYWDVNRTYTEVEKLIDSFQGPGAASSMVQTTVNDRLGVDLVTDILPQVTGRISYMTHITKPVRLDSQAQLIAIELKDADKFRPTLDKIVDRLPGDREKKAYGSNTYYVFNLGLPRAEEGQPAPPQPSLAVGRNCLLIADRPVLLEKVLAGQDAELSLAKQLDFKLIASKAYQQAGQAKPGLLSFNRPEEGLRMLYDLANADQVRKGLDQAGERNKFLRGFGEALQRNPLPPFSVITKYHAPAGAVLTSDDTGFHYVSFSLKRK